jgi:hypothetical protein
MVDACAVESTGRQRSAALVVAVALLLVTGGALCLPARSAETAVKKGHVPAGPVRYGDFGAKGDGKTDDAAAIARAHAYANEHGLPVRADDRATYVIGGLNTRAVIQTDTDFGSATFLIDDTALENPDAPVFEVRSTLEPVPLAGIASLTKNQTRIPVALPRRCLVIVMNEKAKHFIRLGGNANSGKPQSDVFLVDRHGRVDPATPIIWNFDQITTIEALPIDEAPLTIRGGKFTTIANDHESTYRYHARGIAIRRSNVVVDGVEHHITGEGDHGAPYGGFITVGKAAHVTVQNTALSGHTTYRTIGRAGPSVPMGSYDIACNRAIDVAFVRCRQLNDIKDKRYWGIMGSSGCKNLRYEGCSLSRFDAHEGVYNATIRDSTLGHGGINAIGGGTLLIEKTTVLADTFITMRPDYGSTWEGEFIIRNCTFIPAGGRPITASLIGGSHSGQHDFGYPCVMPRQIRIEKLHIDDSTHPDRYQGPAIFANFNQRCTDATFLAKYAYATTERVFLGDVTIASGMPLRLSSNPYLFKDVVVQSSDGR